MTGGPATAPRRVRPRVPGRAHKRSHVARLALLSAAALVLVACGQKPGVHVAGSGSTGGETTGQQPGVAAPASPAPGATPVPAPSAGDPSAPSAGPADATPGNGATPDAGDPAATPGDPTPDGGQGSGDPPPAQPAGDAQPPAAQPTGSDRTGVSGDAITLAVHAPVTGAAPLPSASFEQSRDTYWRYLEARGTDVLGRRVDVVFADDKYDPNSARQVCRQLADGAFMLLGGGGTDQIQACGQYAGAAGVPYLSSGVTEAGLAGNPWYFAVSMSYRQQARLLAQYVRTGFPGARVAAVITDTPNFDDAAAAWEQAVQQVGGIDYYRTLRHPKGDTSWYNTFADDLARAEVDLVYILSSPVDYIRFAQQAAQQGFAPQYVGVGITMGLNAVLGSGCPDVDGGIFFSPYPGLDWARQNEPAFFEASAQQGTPADDVSLALWGIAKIEHALLEQYGAVFGTDLTREDFRAFAETRSARTDLFPDVAYAPGDHFGGRQVHVLQADCAAGEHVTRATFASGF